MYHRALYGPRLSGAVNATAPTPVQNTEYTKTLARVLGRPAILPVPPFGARLLIGEQGSDEVALASQRVMPHRLQAVGHRFRHPSLEETLRHQLGR